MKNVLYKFMALFALVAVVTGCQRNDMAPETPTNDGGEMSIVVAAPGGNASTKVAVNPTGETGYDLSWKVNDHIMVSSEDGETFLGAFKVKEAADIRPDGSAVFSPVEGVLAFKQIIDTTARYMVHHSTKDLTGQSYNSYTAEQAQFQFGYQQPYAPDDLVFPLLVSAEPKKLNNITLTHATTYIKFNIDCGFAITDNAVVRIAYFDNASSKDFVHHIEFDAPPVEVRDGTEFTFSLSLAPFTLDANSAMVISVDNGAGHYQEVYRLNKSQEFKAGVHYRAGGKQWMLADFAGTDLPSGTTWTINDSGMPTAAEYVELKKKLESVPDGSGPILLVFPYLQSIETEAFKDVNPSVEWAIQATAATKVGAKAFENAAKLTEIMVPNASDADNGAFGSLHADITDLNVTFSAATRFSPSMSLAIASSADMLKINLTTHPSNANNNRIVLNISGYNIKGPFKSINGVTIDPVMLTLENIDPANLPEGNTWTITNTGEPTAEAYDNLKLALEAVPVDRGKISVVLENVTKIADKTFEFFKASAVDWSLSAPKATDVGSSSFNDTEKLVEISLPRVVRVGLLAFTSLNDVKTLTIAEYGRIETNSTNYIFGETTGHGVTPIAGVDLHTYIANANNNRFKYADDVLVGPFKTINFTDIDPVWKVAMLNKSNLPKGDTWKFTDASLPKVENYDPLKEALNSINDPVRTIEVIFTGIPSIPDYAFKNATSTVAWTFTAERVYEVGGHAFLYDLTDDTKKTMLGEIHLPAAAKIGFQAFKGQTALYNMTLCNKYQTVTDVSADIFGEIYPDNIMKNIELWTHEGNAAKSYFKYVDAAIGPFASVNGNSEIASVFPAGAKITYITSGSGGIYQPITMMDKKYEDRESLVKLLSYKFSVVPGKDGFPFMESVNWETNSKKVIAVDGPFPGEARLKIVELPTEAEVIAVYAMDDVGGVLSFAVQIDGSGIEFAPTQEIIYKAKADGDYYDGYVEMPTITGGYNFELKTEADYRNFADHLFKVGETPGAFIASYPFAEWSSSLAQVDIVDKGDAGVAISIPGPPPSEYDLVITATDGKNNKTIKVKLYPVQTMLADFKDGWTPSGDTWNIYDSGNPAQSEYAGLITALAAADASRTINVVFHELTHVAGLNDISTNAKWTFSAPKLTGAANFALGASNNLTEVYVPELLNLPDAFLMSTPNLTKVTVAMNARVTSNQTTNGFFGEKAGGGAEAIAKIDLVTSTHNVASDVFFKYFDDKVTTRFKSVNGVTEAAEGFPAGSEFFVQLKDSEAVAIDHETPMPVKGPEVAKILIGAKFSVGTKIGSTYTPFTQTRWVSSEGLAIKKVVEYQAVDGILTITGINLPASGSKAVTFRALAPDGSEQDFVMDVSAN